MRVQCILHMLSLARGHIAHLLGDHHYICNPHHPRKRNAQNGFLTPSRLVRRRPRASTTENNTWQSSHVSHFYFSYSVLRPTGLEQQAPLMYQKRIIIRKSIDCFHILSKGHNVPLNFDLSAKMLGGWCLCFRTGF